MFAASSLKVVERSEACYRELLRLMVSKLSAHGNEEAVAKGIKINEKYNI